MEVTQTPLPGVLVLAPRIFRDDRGSFLETWRRQRYVDAGIPPDFIQDNAAVSRKGVLRGLHYQWPNPQGKLVSVLEGAVFDVVVDIRRGSPHFGQWFGATLSDENGHQMWIPEGLAHGYLALTETTVFAYKCTRAYDPDADAAVHWADPAIGIDWPVAAPILSAKDAAAPLLEALDPARLPPYRAAG